MQRQGSFAQADNAGKNNQTRRDKFLAEVEQVVPWSRLVDRLLPFYPKGAGGRRSGWSGCWATAPVKLQPGRAIFKVRPNTIGSHPDGNTSK